MRRTMLLAIALLVVTGARPWAAEKGEVQISAYLGGQSLQVDAGDIVGEEDVHRGGVLVGAAVAYRFPSGLLLEGSVLHASFDDFYFADVLRRSFSNYHYSAAVGWQFDNGRWRITPKLGVARAKLTASGPILFEPDGELDDKMYATVPFVEASAVRRMGRHLGLGVFLRETFEDFGHSRSWGATLQYYFD